MKKSTGINIVLYGICAVLTVFYVVVLWLGQNPNVCIEYKMYYLTNELTDWPGYGKLSYDLGTSEYCMDNYDEYGQYVTYPVANRKGRGWEKNDSSGSVNKEKSAYMYYIPKQSMDNGKFAVNISKYEGTGKTYVYVDDQCVGSFEGEGKHEFVVPKIDKDEMLVVRFETEEARFTLLQATLG